MTTTQSPQLFTIEQSHNTYFTPVKYDGASIPRYFYTTAPTANETNLAASFHEESRDWFPIITLPCGIVAVENDIKPIISRSGKAEYTFKPLPIFEIRSKRLSKQPPPVYWWFYPPQCFDVRLQRLSQCNDTSENRLHYYFTHGLLHTDTAIGRSMHGEHGIFASISLIVLARKFRWKGLCFRPTGLPSNVHREWSIDYLGKQWPPQWWPDGYEPHPSNVIEAEVPDVKVGEGLVGEFAPAEPPKPKRKAARADGQLITPAAIRGLKLEEGDYGFEGEVSLARPLYGADTLSVSISLEGDDMDEDGPRIKKSLLKTKAQAALTRLEPLLPQIHARLLEEGRPYAPTPEAFLETVHDPAFLLSAADFTQGEKWSFVVESDIVGFHFEFDGDTLLDVWSGD